MRLTPVSHPIPVRLMLRPVALAFGKTPPKCPSREKSLQKWKLRSLMAVPMATIGLCLTGVATMLVSQPPNNEANRQFSRRDELRPVQTSAGLLQQAAPESAQESIQLTQGHFQFMAQHIISHTQEDAALKQLVLNPVLTDAEKIDTMNVYAKLKAGDAHSRELFNEWADQVLAHHMDGKLLAKAKAEVGQYYAQIDQQAALAFDLYHENDGNRLAGLLLFMSSLAGGGILSAMALKTREDLLKKLASENIPATPDIEPSSPKKS